LSDFSDLPPNQAHGPGLTSRAFSCYGTAIATDHAASTVTTEGRYRLPLAIWSTIMAELHDMEFLVLRERQSREMAAEPGDVSVKRAHLNMADGYAAQIVALTNKPL
jgi:hypothetical protein